MSDSEFWSQRWVIALICLLVGFLVGLWVAGRD